MNAAFNSSKWLAKHICNFMVFESIKIEKERVSENLREIVDGILDILYPQIAFRCIGNCPLVHVQ